ncbi:unnamed protein product [Durusdinium trenchii]|uniref:Branched-chain-amino-acid aminotransferase n=2 Tax=Durusdinium trenchii TaxID=1381693 RepID=A0ABP0NRS2_9DINO
MLAVRRAAVRSRLPLVAWTGTLRPRGTSDEVELICLPNAVDRYGTGDAVVKLSVSGTKFLTLRSTLAHSPVLDAIVTSAIHNEELSNDGAIFIDRDPKHFPVILNHLRSKAEGRQTFKNPCKWSCKEGHSVMLPKDPSELRDLFIEAEHFGLPELRGRILKKRKVAHMVSLFSGSAGNPFDLAARSLSTLRNMALVGATTAASGMALLQQLRETEVPKTPTQALETLKSFDRLEKATKDRFSDVLYLDPSGKRVEEAAASNFFCVTKDGKLKTPALGTILAGVTRDSILQLARRLATQSDLINSVEETSITLDEILQAKEAFVTGTAAAVTPVGHVASVLCQD